MVATALSTDVPQPANQLYLVNFAGLNEIHVMDGLVNPRECDLLVKMRKTIHLMPPKRKTDVLEINTGTGALSIFAYSRDNSIKCTAYDSDPRAVKCANVNFQHYNMHINVLGAGQVDVLQPHYYDYIIVSPQHCMPDDTHKQTPASVDPSHIQLATDCLSDNGTIIIGCYANQKRELLRGVDRARFEVHDMYTPKNKISGAGVLVLEAKANHIRL